MIREAATHTTTALGTPRALRRALAAMGLASVWAMGLVACGNGADTPDPNDPKYTASNPAPLDMAGYPQVPRGFHAAAPGTRLRFGETAQFITEDTENTYFYWEITGLEPRELTKEAAAELNGGPVIADERHIETYGCFPYRLRLLGSSAASGGAPSSGSTSATSPTDAVPAGTPGANTGAAATKRILLPRMDIAGHGDDGGNTVSGADAGLLCSVDPARVAPDLLGEVEIGRDYEGAVFGAFTDDHVQGVNPQALAVRYLLPSKDLKREKLTWR